MRTRKASFTVISSRITCSWDSTTKSCSPTLVLPVSPIQPIPWIYKIKPELLTIWLQSNCKASRVRRATSTLLASWSTNGFAENDLFVVHLSKFTASTSQHLHHHFANGFPHCP